MKVLILTRQKIAAACSLLACGLLAAGFFTQGAAVSANATERKLPIYSVETADKKVSLTFDVAWGNEDTEKIINILKKYNVKATFFIVGEWVEKYPESVKSLHAAGHDIENHSDTHPHMTKLSAEQSAAEIKNCNERIKKITGISPTLLRPPYGDYNNSVIESAKSEKMQTIQWDVDSLDWKNPTSDEMQKRISRKVQNGSIILLHVGAKNTPEALPGIIEDLQKQGYSFVTVKELVYPDNATIDSNGRQHKGAVSN